MRQASQALVNLLNTQEQFFMADLYTFTLIGGGGVLRYSAAPTELFVNGNLFQLGPKFERSKTHVVIGTQVDELDVNIYPELTDTVGGMSFEQACWTGQFDGALLQLERAFMPTYGDTSPGTIVLFAGRISDIDCSRTGVHMKCRSHLELLNIQMPRRLWGPTCSHLFGGAMCQFNRSSLSLNFAAGAGSTTTSLTNAPVTSVPYALGTITGLTGQNSGFSRTVAGFKSGGTVTVKLAFLFPVVNGDQFQLLPGCDRTLATCTSAFNNTVHFGGEPFIPTAETSI